MKNRLRKIHFVADWRLVAIAIVATLGMAVAVTYVLRNNRGSSSACRPPLMSNADRTACIACPEMTYYEAKTATCRSCGYDANAPACTGRKDDLTFINGCSMPLINKKGMCVPCPSWSDYDPAIKKCRSQYGIID